MPSSAWFYEAFIMQSDGRILNEDETDIGFNNRDGNRTSGYVEEHDQWRHHEAPQEKVQIPMKQPAGISPRVSWHDCSGIFGDLGTLNSSCDFEVDCIRYKSPQFGVPTGGRY